MELRNSSGTISLGAMDLILNDGDKLFFRKTDGTYVPLVFGSGSDLNFGPLGSAVNSVKFAASESAGTGGLQVDGNQNATSLPKLPLGSGVTTVLLSDGNLYDISVTPHS